MGIETHLRRESAEVETIAASGIEHDVARTCGQHFGDPAQQRLRNAAIVQSASRRHGVRGIAWVLGSPILWLEQVDVPAAGDIE